MGQTVTELTVQLSNTKLVLQAAESHRGVDAGGWWDEGWSLEVVLC